MNVEIRPEPSDDERQAILAALAEEMQGACKPWAEEDEEP